MSLQRTKIPEYNRVNSKYEIIFKNKVFENHGDAFDLTIKVNGHNKGKRILLNILETTNRQNRSNISSFYFFNVCYYHDLPSLHFNHDKVLTILD